jgi:uncharacterized membrane protein YebE (DUF533 family)
VAHVVEDPEGRVRELHQIVRDAGVDASESDVRRQLALAGEVQTTVFEHIPDIRSVGLQVVFLRRMVDTLTTRGPLAGEARAWVQQVAAAFGLDAAVPDATLRIDSASMNDFQRVMCARAIARVILADGVVVDAELDFLASAVSALGFVENDPRVADLVVSERRRPTPVDELAQVLNEDGTRIAVLRAMLQASCIDADLHDEEVVLILRVAEALGVDQDVAVYMVDWSRDWLTSWRH